MLNIQRTYLLLGINEGMNYCCIIILANTERYLWRALPSDCVTSSDEKFLSVTLGRSRGRKTKDCENESNASFCFGMTAQFQGLVNRNQGLRPLFYAFIGISEPRKKNMSGVAKVSPGYNRTVYFCSCQGSCSLEQSGTFVEHRAGVDTLWRRDNFLDPLSGILLFKITKK